MKRQIRVQDKTAYLMLPSGQEVILDIADIPLVEGVSWWAHPTPRSCYALSKNSRLSKGRLLMHRAMLSAPKGMFVDHINGNGLDNRRENIRLVTHMENVWNRSATEKSAVGFKGVCKQNKGFVAKITTNHRRVLLGWFPTPEQASEAYQRAALEQRPDFTHRTK